MHTPKTMAAKRPAKGAALRASARRLGWAATLAAAAGAAVALLGGGSWPFELACHLRVVYAGLAGGGLLAAAVGRSARGAAAAALVLTWQLAGVAPWYWPAAQPAGQGPPLRIMALNVNCANRLHARAVSAIRAAKPDLVFVIEVDARWMKALSALRDELPYVYAEPREGSLGMAVFSRKPWLEARSLDAEGAPLLEVTVDHQGQSWRIIGAHLFAPVRRDASHRRDAQLAYLAEQARGRSPVVVIGDLNITSWSPEFDRFLERAKMRDSRAGLGLQPTWPAQVPLLRIPIDHALVSPDVVVVDRSVGPEFGSDHLPIVVDLRAAATNRPPAVSRRG